MATISIDLSRSLAKIEKLTRLGPALDGINDGGGMEIPVEAIAEARHALAEKYVALVDNLDRSRLISKKHRKRIESKSITYIRFLTEIDNWLEAVKNEHNNG